MRLVSASHAVVTDLLKERREYMVPLIEDELRQKLGHQLVMLEALEIEDPKVTIFRMECVVCSPHDFWNHVRREAMKLHAIYKERNASED